MSYQYNHKKIKRNVVAFILYLQREFQKASFKIRPYRHYGVYTLRAALCHSAANAHIFATCRFRVLNQPFI